MKIGIIVAMDKELAMLSALLDNRSEERHGGVSFLTGTMGDKAVTLMKCGIGKVNSAIGAVEMISSQAPDLVISTGVAGGADVSMSVTDVVVGTEYRYHDVYCGPDCLPGQIQGQPPSFAAPAQLIDKALALGGDTTVHAGLIVSGDWFVDSRDKMRAILATHPEAKAVDMESCSIAHTCGVYGVPFVSFRVISDIPLKDEKAAQYFDFWARLAEGSFDVTRRFLENIGQ